MKKQLIAKFLVLVMALSMVPVAAFAIDGGGAINGNAAVSTTPYNNPDDPYNNPYTPDPDPTPTPDPVPDGSNTTTAPSAPAEADPVVIDSIKDIKTETNEAGQTVVTATIEVADATAPVAVSEAAVDALVEQAKEGDVVAIVASTTGAVSAPAAKLAELIEKTGNAVSMGNNVAAVAVNKALINLAGNAEVKVEPVQNADGTISVPVTAGGKEIAPESVPGGIDVEVPVSYTEDEVSGVNAVKANKTEVELRWSISFGKLQVNLTVTGSIKIVRK